MGNKEFLRFFDEDLSNPNVAYEPKSNKVFVAKTSQDVIINLPFTVKSSEAIYAGIVELSGQGLDIAIYSDETQEEIAISEQGKYYSQINLVVLPKGKYYFIVRSQASDNHTVRFALDVVRHVTSEHGDWQDGML